MEHIDIPAVYCACCGLAWPQGSPNVRWDGRNWVCRQIGLCMHRAVRRGA